MPFCTRAFDAITSLATDVTCARIEGRQADKALDFIKRQGDYKFDVDRLNVS